VLAYVIWRNWNPAPGSGGPGLSEALQRPIQLHALFLAALICSVSVLLTFVRWYVLVRAQDLPFTLPNALRLGLVGYFFNSCLPGSVGGDIIKAACIAREQSRRTIAVATVLIDRAVGLWGLVWLVALLGGAFWAFGNQALADDPYLQYILRSAWLIVGMTVAVWLLLGVLPEWRAQRFARRLEWLPKIGHSLAEFWRAIWMYRCRGKSILIGLLLALLGHTGFVLTFYFAAQTFQQPGEMPDMPTLVEHYLIVPVGMAIESLFPAPGGVGGGEYGFGMLYVLLGKPEANGVLGALARRAITWFLGFCGYLVYLRMRPFIREQTRELAQPDAASAVNASETTNAIGKPEIAVQKNQRS